MARCLGCMVEYKEEYGICPHCGYKPGTPAESALHMQPGTVLTGHYLLGKVVGIDKCKSHDASICDPACGSGSLLIRATAEAP